MRKISMLLIILLISLNLIAQEQPAKVVFIIVDGIPADVIEKLPTPNLNAITEQGGYTRAYVGGTKDKYSQTPTISAVGYNSLLTGTWVNEHNVWGNAIKDPNYNYWTLFRYAEKLQPTLKTDIFSTWQDNRTKLVGEGLAETGNIQLDYHFDGFELDTIQFPHDPKSDYTLNIDNHVVAEASRYIKTESPDLFWIYLQHTDDMGHKCGDGDLFYEAVEQMDEQIGQIWAAIKTAQKEKNENLYYN